MTKPRPKSPADVPPLPPDTRYACDERLEHMRRWCIECGSCVRECEFLRRHGTPARVAEKFLAGSEDLGRTPFECSLCGLCAAVCPLDLDPKAMFLDLRRKAVRQGLGRFAAHARLMGYEARGASPLFSWYGLPEGCDTVFFPGCTLPGTRPAVTRQLFARLAATVPRLGVVLDCCAKPSHDLGREERFGALFPEMLRWLAERGVRRVLTACPNCHKVWTAYGGDIRPVTVYEHLAALGPGGIPALEPAPGAPPATTLHDPCPLRREAGVQAAVRELVRGLGLSPREMKHHGAKTVCCGEGGTVGALAPDLSGGWGDLRRTEARGELVLTYCAGCVNYLGARMRAAHVLDALFFPRRTLDGRARVAKSPMTYLHRLRLKRWFRRHLRTAHERTRPRGLAGG